VIFEYRLDYVIQVDLDLMYSECQRGLVAECDELADLVTLSMITMEQSWIFQWHVADDNQLTQNMIPQLSYFRIVWCCIQAVHCIFLFLQMLVTLTMI
jgi:hypothetical protein